MEPTKKRYGIVWEDDVFDSPEEALKDIHPMGERIRQRIFELGQEYEIVLEEPSLRVREEDD